MTHIINNVTETVPDSYGECEMMPCATTEKCTFLEYASTLC